MFRKLNESGIPITLLYQSGQSIHTAALVQDINN